MSGPAALVFLAMVFAAAQAEVRPAELDPGRDFNLSLAPFTAQFRDRTAALTVEDLRAQRGLFRQVRTPYLDFGLSDARIWLRVALRNPSAEAGVWRLDLRRQYLEDIEVHAVRGAGPPELILRHTAADVFAARPVASRYLAADLPLAAGETTEIYVGYRSGASTWLPMRIATHAAYERSHAAEDRLNWLLHGALAAMLLLALLMMPVIGWRVSLAFCFYILPGTAFVFHADGETFKHLWPNWPALNGPLGLTFALLMSVSGPLFAKVLFDTRRHVPALDRVLTAAAMSGAVLALLSPFLFGATWFMLIGYPFVVLGGVLHLATGIIVYRNGLLGGSAFLAGAAIAVVSFLYALAAHVFPGHFHLERTLDAGHAALLAQTMAFAAAIVIRMLALRRERDDALRAELAVAQEKLRLSAALRRSQRDYDRAWKLSEQRRIQLSSASHDLQQPLVSLRAALERIGGSDEATVRQMHAAFDYLETLARRQIENTRPGDAPADGPGRETFPVRAVLDNVVEMFADEAAAKGLSLRYRPLDARITSDPIGLMRIVSNLVANAIKHTRSGGVLVGCRCRGAGLRIEIWDTGPGMDADQIDRIMQPFAKGAASAGSGLGLAIVSGIARELGFEFSLRSRPGKGTVAAAGIPSAV